MAIEAEVLARKQEDAALPADRRAQPDRRARDRRKPGSRINQKAPMRSSMRGVGLSALGVVATVMVITVVYSQVAGVSCSRATKRAADLSSHGPHARCSAGSISGSPQIQPSPR